jgi:hypothetical protein
VEPEYGRLPEKVTVRFRKSPIPTDGTSWYYTVDVADTETTEALTGTRVILDDDLLALYNTVPAITNAAGCATRAAERAAAWFKAARLAGQKESLEYRGIRGTDAVAALGSLYGEVAWLDRGGGYRTALAARLAKGDGWTGSQAEVFVADPVQAIDLSGRSGSIADVTALQILRGVISGTAGAAVFTPDDASETLPGDVNLTSQSWVGRKQITSDGTDVAIRARAEASAPTYRTLEVDSEMVINDRNVTGATPLGLAGHGFVLKNHSTETSIGLSDSDNASAIRLHFDKPAAPITSAGTVTIKDDNGRQGQFNCDAMVADTVVLSNQIQAGYTSTTGDNTFWHGANQGQTGTSGGGDTVSGGIITTLGSGPSGIDGGTF